MEGVIFCWIFYFIRTTLFTCDDNFFICLLSQWVFTIYGLGVAPPHETFAHWFHEGCQLALKIQWLFLKIIWAYDPAKKLHLGSHTNQVWHYNDIKPTLKSLFSIKTLFVTKPCLQNLVFQSTNTRMSCTSKINYFAVCMTIHVI